MKETNLVYDKETKLRWKVIYGFNTTNWTYFTITTNGYNERNILQSFGQCKDIINRLFPELKKYLPWHLCDTNGIPLYYIDNAIYWIENELSLNEYETNIPDGYKSFKQILSKHLLCKELEDEHELDKILVKYNISSFINWLQARESKLMDKFNSVIREML